MVTCLACDAGSGMVKDYLGGLGSNDEGEWRPTFGGE